MHVILVGSSMESIPLSQWIISAGHELTIVELNSKLCSLLDEYLGSVCVPGNGTDKTTLTKAGATRADILIATTGQDDINLTTCQLAKHHFGISKTISVVNSSQNVPLFELLGIESTINFSRLIIEHIQEEIDTQGIRHLKSTVWEDGKSLFTIEIPTAYVQKDQLLSKIQVPDGVMVPLIISMNGKPSLPNEETIIHKGDRLVTLSTRNEALSMRESIMNILGEQP